MRHALLPLALSLLPAAAMAHPGHSEVLFHPHPGEIVAAVAVSAAAVLLWRKSRR